MALNSLPLARGLNTVIETFALTGGANYDLPSTGIKAGQMVLVQNSTANSSVLTVRSSDASSIETIRKGYCFLVATQDTPVSASHWSVIDVYEEGTWTPTISGQAGAFSSVTYVTQHGTFSRQNRTVWSAFTVSWSAATGGSGNLLITGLPYAAQSVGQDDFPGAALIGNIDLTVGYTAVMANVPNSANFFQPQQYGDSVAASLLNVSVANSGTFNKKFSGATQYLKN